MNEPSPSTDPGELRPASGLPAESPEMVATIRRVLRRHPEVRLALLFGSRAKGNARSDSDLDLALAGGDLDVIALTAELSLATGAEVDLTDLKYAGYPLRRVLLREGRLLYESERGTWARWRSATIASIELDRPWYERMQAGFLRRLASRRLEDDTP